MKTEELSQKVLETIKDKHLKPKPKWEFMLKNYIIWILSITSLVVGSFAFAVIIYMVRNSNWDLYQNLSGNLLGLILASLPYFWFIFLIIFILISYYNFRHTKSGYRYKFYLIVVSSISLSVLLGVFFYNVGLGQTIDDVFQAKLPIYRNLMLNRARIWHQPERGLLIGQVTALGEDSQFSLEDFDGYIWQVFYGQAKIPPAMIIQPGLKLQIVGNKIDDNQFEAQLLRPLNPPFHQPFMRSLLDKQPPFPDMPEGMRGNIPPPPNIPDMK